MRRRGRPGLLGVAARTAVVAGTATAVSGSVRNKQEAKQEAAAQEQQQQAAAAQPAAAPTAPADPAPAPAAAPSDDLVDQLQQLTDLKNSGALTQEEFDAAKVKLLGS